jgi:FMN phosphatase YigB (HAD superfamily)
MKKALVTDVDNTLFDWVDIWYKSFTAMMARVAEISAIPASDLYPSISKVHQRYGTSEYAFLLEEIPELKSRYGERILEVFEPAITAFRQARKESLHLYPTVMPTLKALKDRNIVLVAFTESMSFYSNYRFRKLELDRVFDFLYSPPDHDLPVDDILSVRKYSKEHYKLSHTVQRHTPKGEKKPNPHILSAILGEIGVSVDEAMYVGDSLMKDVAMAQDARVLDALAAYGAAQHTVEYELLKRVTHWTQAEVEREKRSLVDRQIRPTIVLQNNLSEILPHFELK